MSDTKSIWLAVRADRRGTSEIYGVYTVKGLADQRLKLALTEAAKRQFWHVGNASEFMVIEATLDDRLDNETVREPVMLSSPAGGVFTASGR